jgi:hypothetical protein
VPVGPSHDRRGDRLRLVFGSVVAGGPTGFDLQARDVVPAPVHERPCDHRAGARVEGQIEVLRDSLQRLLARLRSEADPGAPRAETARDAPEDG